MVYPNIVLYFSSLFFLLTPLFLLIQNREVSSEFSFRLPLYKSPTDNSKRSSLRIAVCLAGHLRTFTNNTVRQSIKFHLVQPLQKTGAHVDVFFHVGLHDVPKAGTSKSEKNLTFLSARTFLEEFFPIHVSWYGKIITDCKQTKCRSKNGSICPHALVRLEQCLVDIKKVERRTGKRYDWIYRSRPDVAFGYDISVPESLHPKVVYTNQHIPGTSVHAHPWIRNTFPKHKALVRTPIGDQVVVAERQVAEIAFRAVHGTFDCQLMNRMNKGTINSEVILTYWLVKHGIAYETRPWFWMLVREKTGPECHRVEWIRRNRTRDSDLVNRCLSFRQSGIIPP